MNNISQIVIREKHLKPACSPCLCGPYSFGVCDQTDLRQNETRQEKGGNDPAGSGISPYHFQEEHGSFFGGISHRFVSGRTIFAFHRSEK